MGRRSELAHASAYYELRSRRMSQGRIFSASLRDSLIGRVSRALCRWRRGGFRAEIAGAAGTSKRHHDVLRPNEGQERSFNAVAIRSISQVLQGDVLWIFVEQIQPRLHELYVCNATVFHA